MSDLLKPFHETIVTALKRAQEESNPNTAIKLIGLAMNTKVPSEHAETVLEEVKATIEWLRELVDTTVQVVAGVTKDYLQQSL